jgi:hypothetical protein
MPSATHLVAIARSIECTAAVDDGKRRIPADHGIVGSVTENAPTAIRLSCGRVVTRLRIFEEGATMPSPNHAWSGATGCRSAIRAQWIAGVETVSRTEVSPHAQ